MTVELRDKKAFNAALRIVMETHRRIKDERGLEVRAIQKCWVRLERCAILLGPEAALGQCHRKARFIPQIRASYPMLAGLPHVTRPRGDLAQHVMDKREVKRFFPARDTRPCLSQ